MKGTLYVCATPIGNMKDITLRVLEILEGADLIAAEDTRSAAKILNHFDIKTPRTSLHRHNEREKSTSLIAQLLAGKNIALVSDAGTPGISDPGETIIRQAIEQGIDVVIAPGAAACVAGLVVSGLPTERFSFEGFLPRQKKRRRAHLENLTAETRTLVFYEAPHRLLDTLKDMVEVLGDRRAAVVRELTKKFEQIVRGTLSEIMEEIGADEPRGEYVLVVEGESGKERADGEDDWKYLSVWDHYLQLMQKGLSKKEAVQAIAGLRHLPRRDIYQHILEKE